MGINAWFEKAMAGRWIAGRYAEDALRRTKEFNSFGISTLINFLGEDISDGTKVKESVDVYLGLLGSIRGQGLDASISVKPTQLGLLVDYRMFILNYTKILKAAKKGGVFVWLDMETYNNIDRTIKAYKSSMGYGNSGICIQAYLRRSADDVSELLKGRATIRLVKGAYKVADDLRYNSTRELNSNYMKIMRMLFSRAGRFMIATHDSRIIEEAIRINRSARRNMMFGMLNGIRNTYAMHLAGKGYKVAEYVPFGSDWISYGLRRITEEKHFSLIVRSMLEKQGL
ncbi:MAG: proline dehydrogenase family protein [Candidatus Micrarchaeaceae archaeon]